MNFQAIDWLIVLALIVTLFIAALSTRRYTRTASAFLVADRCAGRYLLGMASGMAGLGVITMVWFFEQNYQVGFTNPWWGMLTYPALIIMGLSGWVVYRFRETRAMTLAQFFEMRYSRRFRVFAGLVAYLSGILNFAIFPSVGARFFIALCGLPDEFAVLGLGLPTYPLVMASLLSVALVFTFLGGQIAVMLTDFIQGVFAHVVFAAVMLYLLLSFPWEHIGEALLSAPKGASLVNPLDLGKEEHFNIWYYIIAVVIAFYAKLGWQGEQGYYGSARNAHEAKMAGILIGWRWWVLMHITVVAPIVIYTVMHHPAYADVATSINGSLEQVVGPDDNVTTTLRNQTRTPYALALLLPTGLLGLFGAAMLAAFVSTHDTYLHSWGSILIQDVILPFRKRPLSPRQHVWALRLSIFGVAVFIFFFSLLFRHVQFIAMFCALTASIFIGGVGSVLIGGLYWRRGTTPAAWVAMIAGMGLSLAGIIIKQRDPDFPLTGQEMAFWAIVAAITLYVAVSLFGPRRSFDMDRLLRRGTYAVAEDVVVLRGRKGTWLARLGVDPEFTGGDKIVALISVAWPLFWTAVLIFGTLYALAGNVSDENWLAYWHWWTWLILVGAIGVTLWFTAGGVGDVIRMFRLLATRPPDPTDDGRVRSPAEQGERHEHD